MTEPLLTREQCYANARAALDQARARRDADYAAGRLAGDQLAAYEHLLAEVRAGALRNAARIWRDGADAMDRMTVPEAARACYCPGGPSLAELEQRIRADRAARTIQPRDARAADE
ncbi:hypothetical protein AB0I93_00105 [Streptomyces sp. NPDC049967]|uniref:hypothetical protein n=1 Tax=Streptomyces sp. NPDC049967 TaxID=3155658 RepID=UPI00342FA4D0